MTHELDRLCILLDLIADEFDQFEFESDLIGVFNGEDTGIILFKGDQEFCTKVTRYAKKLKKQPRIFH